MSLQIKEAVYQNRDVTPYPVFLQQRVAEGKVRDSHLPPPLIHTLSLSLQLELGAGREHTQDYLQSYTSGKPHPPVHYYRKVAGKDDPSQLLTGKDLADFNQLIK